MRNFFVVCCALHVFISLTSADYYWKDYYGEIPFDAFIGGTDEFGKPTYIGQTYFYDRKVIVPTIIKNGLKKAYTGLYDRKYESDKSTKILCTDSPEELNWVLTNTTHIHYLTECPHVRGGVYENEVVTIGRANYSGRIQTGMVFDSGFRKWYGLWIFDDKFRTVKLNQFEVLTWLCGALCPYDIDVRNSDP